MENNKENYVDIEKPEATNQKSTFDFRFFKCCSATLKKFSVIVFVMNMFITLVVGAVSVVLLGVYIGTQMMSLLLVPIICVVVILILVSRLVSALIYGFAEIVEKYENK